MIKGYSFRSTTSGGDLSKFYVFPYNIDKTGEPCYVVTNLVLTKNPGDYAEDYKNVRQFFDAYLLVRDVNFQDYTWLEIMNCIVKLEYEKKRECIG